MILENVINGIVKDEEKNKFHQLCLPKLVDENGRLRFNLESVATDEDIPIKNLRQFKRNGVLGNPDRNKLAKRLFNKERWIEVVQPSAAPAEREGSAGLMPREEIRLLWGEIAILKNRLAQLESRPQRGAAGNNER